MSVASGYVRFTQNYVPSAGTYVLGVLTFPGGTLVLLQSVYTVNGNRYTVVAADVGGTGTITVTGLVAPAASGTLTLLSGQGAATINYGTVTFSGQYVDLRYNSIRGLDDPDDIRPFPAVKNDIIDGSSNTQFKAFGRNITVDLGPLLDRNARIILLYWYIDNNRTLDYNSADSGLSEAGLSVNPKDTSDFKNTWLQGFSGARAITLALQEATVRTSFPV